MNSLEESHASQPAMPKPAMASLSAEAIRDRHISHMTELPKRANLPIRVYTPPSVEEHDAGHDEVLEASVSDVTADALYA